MPGEDYQIWSVTAANNGNADTSIEWREGQTRASVNNSARSEMAAHAKNRNLLNGSIVTGGTANAQTFTSGVGYIAPIPTGLIAKLKIGAGLTNTAPATLNMDGIGATPIKTDTGENVKGGELVGGCYTDFIFDGTNWIFLYSREFWQEQINGGGGIIIGKQVFSTAGSFTYTPTTGTESCIIECIGGGGGGGGSINFSGVQYFIGAAGGGGGSRSLHIATAADIGASQAITVGAGGAAGPVNSGTGGTGGDSSFGALCIGKGGSGGQGIPPTGVGTTPASPGLGGVAGTGNLATGVGAPGGPGAFEIDLTKSTGSSGWGGSTALGGGGPAVPGANGQGLPGIAGSGPGAGGSGACGMNNTALAMAGGAGAPGIVIVTEYAGRGAPGRDGEEGPMGPPGPSGAGTGDVLRSGAPTVGQIAQWTDGSHIAGVNLDTLGTLSAVVVQRFTTPGAATYTPTASMKFCIIECTAGGGGGGGSFALSGSAYFVGAGGGGAGGLSRHRATAADIGASKAVTVGAAGSAGAAGGGAGGNGGDTSVSTLCIAKGGNGGAGTAPVGAGNSPVAGGAGGIAGTGNIVTGTGQPGGAGSYCMNLAVAAGSSGYGGSTALGGGGTSVPGSNAVGVNGLAGSGFGAGGSGACGMNGAALAATGGAGAAGVVIITEYI